MEYTGRPFGGVSIVCKQRDGVYPYEIGIESDRIVAIGVKDGFGKLVQIVISVYMPHFDGTARQTAVFVETIDALQCFLDTHGNTAPIFICGDLNVQLPRSDFIDPNWCRRPGYNRHSSIMYDFMQTNDLLVTDFLYDQNVSYTYFCNSRNIFTWIDHVLVVRSNRHLVKTCQIVPPSSGNVSDHLPLRVETVVGLQNEPASPKYGSSRVCPRWNNPNNVAQYRARVVEQLLNLPPVERPNNREEAQYTVDAMTANLSSILHGATSEAGCVPKKVHKPKAYWCPQLDKLRQKKLFWWRLWVDNGRPRHGAVYSCWKNVKKLFRRVSRQCVRNVMDKPTRDLDNLFSEGNINAFWSSLKRVKRGKQPNSCLDPQSFADYLAGMMSDNAPLTVDQEEISNSVKETYLRYRGSCGSEVVGPETVSKIMKQLKRNSAPGSDNITAEHLIFAKSPILCEYLSVLFTNIINWHVLPDSFLEGVIVPVLKKSSLSPNDVSNYRPITLSSILSKMLERLLIPDDAAHPNQFGFREGRGTAVASSFLFDVCSYFSSAGTPVFVCSLDAEKCFDTIWHQGLFYKLWSKIPTTHWLLLYTWYGNLRASVRFKGCKSESFSIGRGIRQGSVLSPILFNYFIDDLLEILDKSKDGLRLGDKLFNSSAYADDLTVFAASVPGLQRLIDVCYDYSVKWRFSFGIRKTSCMIVGKKKWLNPPAWKLGSKVINTVDCMTILGNSFNWERMRRSCGQ